MKPQIRPPREEKRSLIDEFNDFVILINPDKWSTEARNAYNGLVRRLERVR